MLKKFADFEKTKAYGNYQSLPKGGYVISIKAVSLIGSDGKQIAKDDTTTEPHSMDIAFDIDRLFGRQHPLNQIYVVSRDIDQALPLLFGVVEHGRTNQWTSRNLFNKVMGAAELYTRRCLTWLDTSRKTFVVN